MKAAALMPVLHKYADFLEDREKAMAVCRSFQDWEAHTQKDWELMYDFCFRGMDADFQAPLWESVCKGDKALLNRTTLEIIQFYHRWGYEPYWIDGNPPDYLGEELSFLLYLAEGKTDREEERLEAVRALIDEHILILAHQLSRSLDSYQDCYEGIAVFMRKLVGMLSVAEFEKEDCGKGEYMLALEIGDEPEQIIPTGGINNCGGICVIRPHVRENCMLQIETDCRPDHAPQIRACVRGRGYRKTFLSPDRLRYPMRRLGERGGSKFERISWETAVRSISEEMVRTRKQYGPGSRYLVHGSGVRGIMDPGGFTTRLLALDGGYLDAFNTYSSACVTYISDYVYGTADAGSSASTLTDTRLLILWASNPGETIYGPERNYYLAELKKKGIKIIVIDPRLSQTGAAYADEWFAIRPSSDAALADAMAYTILQEGLQDQKFMDTYCLGFDEAHMPEGIPCGESYRAYLFGVRDGISRSPEWAEKITGIEADRIRRLAREFAAAKPACIDVGLGIQRTGNGEQASRGVMMLCCLTGNVGIGGGGSGGNSSRIKEHRAMRNYVSPVPNPYPGKIPTFLWTRAIEHGTEMTPSGDRLKGVERLESNIRMLFCIAGNTMLNQHSNINDTVRILRDSSKCEMIVCSDIFMTPSARFADIVLPATSVFEGENMIGSWAGSNYYLKHNKVIRPFFECRFEWDWLKEAAAQLGVYDAFTAGMPELSQWLRENYRIIRETEPELPDYETFSREGGWQYKKQIRSAAFEKEIREPEKYPFPTPSGKIEIFSKRLYDLHQDDISAIPRYMPCAEGPEDPLRERFPLQLIGWHTRRRCHSIHDNNEWMDEIEKPGLWINPEDAEARGIGNGAMVEIFNDRGCVRIPAVVTARIRPGVVAMSQGGWYTPDRNGVDIRGSINVLTSTANPTPICKGNPQHTNLVEVRRTTVRD